MRLWHKDLIKYLPRQQLLSQHRECAALRGKGWGKKHSTVDYVFRYSPVMLYQYHFLIIKEMYRRNYKVTQDWAYPEYRGINCTTLFPNEIIFQPYHEDGYPEHNDEYLKECLENLKRKGIIIDIKIRRIYGR
jgi:uncharacterized protein (TIGR02328 family)